jgi:hypothetical protein
MRSPVRNERSGYSKRVIFKFAMPHTKMVNANEAFRLIFSGIADNVSYIITYLNISVPLIGCSLSYLKLI